MNSIEQLEQEKKKLQESIDKINREITENKFQITSEKLTPILSIIQNSLKNFLLIQTSENSYEIHKVVSYSSIENVFGQATLTIQTKFSLYKYSSGTIDIKPEASKRRIEANLYYAFPKYSILSKKEFDQLLKNIIKESLSCIK